MRCVTFSILLFMALIASAQEAKDTPEAALYRAEFNIRDGSSDAAAKPGRRYAMLIDSTGRGVLRVGSRVPYATGSFQPAGTGEGLKPLVTTQFQYLDVGVNIDCRVRDLKGKVGLSADIDVSTIADHPKAAGSAQPNPTIASVRMNVNAILVPGKPTLIASINDPATMRQFDVEATVVRVD